MPRNLQTQTIRRFRGIQVWQSFPTLSPEFATDCLNVICSTSGSVEKMRAPVRISMGLPNGIQRMAGYQNAAGQRQILAQSGQELYKFELADASPFDRCGDAQYGITTPCPVAEAQVGVAYSLQFTASGGTGQYVWSIASGTLPTGLTLSASGLLSGIPSASGTFDFVVQVADAG